MKSSLGVMGAFCGGLARLLIPGKGCKDSKVPKLGKEYRFCRAGRIIKERGVERQKGNVNMKVNVREDVSGSHPQLKGRDYKLVNKSLLSVLNQVNSKSGLTEENSAVYV